MIWALLYFVPPVVGILISGRKLTLKGWLIMLFLWPVAWAFIGPEELP